MASPLSNDCPICGAPIPERPRGSRHGHPPKTCGERCRKIRAAQRERARYQRVKGTQAWQDVRAAYTLKLRDRLAADPKFAKIFRAESALRSREWKARLRATDPERHEAMKEEKRAERSAWRASLLADPAAWEAHKAACRAWYAALPTAEKERIFNVPRRRQQEGTALLDEMGSDVARARV